METSVYYSPLLFCLMRLETLYPDGLPAGIAMDVMVAFFITNNFLRHQYFFDDNLEAGVLWQDETYVEQFMTFLLDVYGSWNGRLGPLSGDSDNRLRARLHGAQRWQSTTNHAVVLEMIYRSLQNLKGIIMDLNDDWMNKCSMSAEKYRRIIRKMIQKMEGFGVLICQKILHCSVMIGLVLDTRLLDYCIPGSSQHTKRLKEQFQFSNSEPTKQLVRVLMHRRGFSALKAEEILCYTLKQDSRRDFATP